MKPSPPRSSRAGGARPRLSMKPPRKFTGLSPRAVSRVSLALCGLRLRQIRPHGVPTWVPSLLAGLPLHHERGSGRQAGGFHLPLEIRRRKDGRNREGRGGSPDARGGDRGAARVGGRGAPGLGAGRDAPAVGDCGAPGLGAGRDAPADGDRGALGGDDDGGRVGGDSARGLGEDKKEYDLVEGLHPILLDIDRWLGVIDQEDIPGEDGSHLYLPYLLPSAKGECEEEKESVTDGEDEKCIAELNIDLAGQYSGMLDTYVEIHGCVAQKWKLKKNLDNVSWDSVQKEVRSIDARLKDLCATYKDLEKRASVLVNKICSMSMEPLQPPPLLKRSPDQLDAKKERRRALKEHRKEEKKRRREDYKKDKKDVEKGKKAVKPSKEVKAMRSAEKEAKKKRKEDTDKKSKAETKSKQDKKKRKKI